MKNTKWLPWPLCTRFRFRSVSFDLEEEANWSEECNPSAIMVAFTADLNIVDY